jgi:hypothetical protein
MIRAFELFCKLNFINVSADGLFNKYMAEFKPNEHSCPWCSTKEPDWKKHAAHERWLISYEDGGTDTYCLEITRYTNAHLVDILIQYCRNRSSLINPTTFFSLLQ